MNPLMRTYPYLLQGAGMTLMLAAASILPAALAGLALAVAGVFGGVFTRMAIGAYLFVIRGTPLLVLMFFVYYSLPYTGIDLPPFAGVVLVMAVYYAAFMSEVFRAGMLSLPKAQWDAAKSLGMTRLKMLRVVIFPQAFRVAAPPFVNICVSLVKATSLVSIVGLWELTQASREVVERTLAPGQIFLGTAFIYFVICFGLARYAAHLERRAAVGH